MQSCPCGSGQALAECCLPRIEGARPAETAEALLRSRYTAFAIGEIDYVVETLHPDKQAEHDAEGLREWSEGSDWLGLEIVQVAAGGADDEEGLIEFVATYRDREKGEEVRHHERSLFRQHEGRWVFVDGEAAKGTPYQREEPKVGRNEPCPCGSGRKYKKCCAVAA